MPPASAAARLLPRKASSKEVLPWSTWPMRVTTGGRSGNFERSSALGRGRLPRSIALISTSDPASTASSSTISVESGCDGAKISSPRVSALLCSASNDNLSSLASSSAVHNSGTVILAGATAVFFLLKSRSLRTVLAPRVANRSDCGVGGLCTAHASHDGPARDASCDAWALRASCIA